MATRRHLKSYMVQNKTSITYYATVHSLFWDYKKVFHNIVEKLLRYCPFYGIPFIFLRNQMWQIMYLHVILGICLNANLYVKMRVKSNITENWRVEWYFFKAFVSTNRKFGLTYWDILAFSLLMFNAIMKQSH